MPNKFVGFFNSILGKEISQPTKDEIIDYDKEDRKFKLRFNQTYLSSRKTYGLLTFLIVSLWLGVMIYFVASQGLGHLPWKKDSKFSLSEPVIIAVITTTTINVLALLIIVLRSLFPGNNALPSDNS